jgi:hypothetical protein
MQETQDQQEKFLDEVVNQIKKEWIYNIKPSDENRVKLFAGEGGQMVQSDINSFLYIGGFMGT